MERPQILVRFKKLCPEAVAPVFSSEDAAGMDFVAISKNTNFEYGYDEYGTGIAVEIPKGWVGLCFPRSSVSNTLHTLANCVGVVDADYRGEVKARFLKRQSLTGMKNEEYKPGDRIFQMVLVQNPKVDLIESNVLSETKRGSGGWGSTGR